MHPNLAAKVKDGEDKMVRAGFIREVQYPTWLANIVPVKRSRWIRVCIDFRDLNRGSPKDDFRVSHMELLITTTIYEALCFKDGY